MIIGELPALCLQKASLHAFLSSDLGKAGDPQSVSQETSVVPSDIRDHDDQEATEENGRTKALFPLCFNVSKPMIRRLTEKRS